MARSKPKEVSLSKILFVLALLAVAAVGVMRLTDWLTTDRVEAALLTAAPGRLVEARALVAAGEYGQARHVLLPLVEQLNDAAITPQALQILAEIAEAEEDAGEALGYYKQLTERFPDAPDHTESLLLYAKALEKNARGDEAREIYQNLEAIAPPDLRAPAVLARAEETLAASGLEEALPLFRQTAEEAVWGSEAWEKAWKHIGDYNVSRIFSSVPTEDSIIHLIQRGETLTSIGIHYNTTQGLLMRANNITDPAGLQLNQPLKITPKDFRIVIERSTCRLYLLDSKGVFKLYRVGLGREDKPTTLGTYRIGNKEKDPAWFPPGRAPIPSGDPLNELGTRWMPLVPAESNLPTDLGIHGTIHPETIGTYASSGCPRLYKEGVEELYDLVVRATPVDIVEVFDPENAKSPVSAAVAQGASG